MERLTYTDKEMEEMPGMDCPVREDDGSIVQKFCGEVCGEFGKDCPYKEMGKKLKEYEDAEEKGLLLRLPCKVGDTVYFLTRRYDRQKRVFVPVVHNGYVKAIKFSTRPTKITVEYEDLDSIGHCKGADYYVSNIGKSLFFTKAEAEKHWQK